MKMDSQKSAVLVRAAKDIGTPCYVYFVEDILGDISRVKRAFSDRFEVSYAVKSNPNRKLLQHIRSSVSTLDVSSMGELDTALEVGYQADELTFSGPAKRDVELQRAVDVGCGEMVCESERELDLLNELAGSAGRRMNIFIRISPNEVPKYFGLNMAGRPTQFGFDEDDVDDILSKLDKWENLTFCGFHCYSGTNCLKETAIAENFAIFIKLFVRFSENHQLRPVKLIFGSGFGIPYSEGDKRLDLEELAALINPQIDELRLHPNMAQSRCVLEMGRFLVGENGYFLTSAIGEKLSHGTEIRLMDGGMNNHLAACGLMGMIIRRAYPMWNVSNFESQDSLEYMLVGPLCTTIDTLAEKVSLPKLNIGDIVAVGSSGAYGLTSSPNRFISHPEPSEVLVVQDGIDAKLIDATLGK